MAHQTVQPWHPSKGDVDPLLSWAFLLPAGFHGCLDLDLGLQLHPIAKLTIDPGAAEVHLSRARADCTWARSASSAAASDPAAHEAGTRGNPQEKGIPRFHEISKISDLLWTCWPHLAPPSKERSIVSKGTNNSCSSSCLKNLSVVNGAHSRISG